MTRNVFGSMLQKFADTLYNVDELFRTAFYDARSMHIRYEAISY